MGRMARSNFTMEGLKNYCETHTQIQAGVYYSPVKNKIVTVINGYNISFHGSKGIFYSRNRRLTKSYVKIGDLV